MCFYFVSKVAGSDVANPAGPWKSSGRSRSEMFDMGPRERPMF